MNCEAISVRKLDYYVNNPFACIIDVRDEKDYLKAHIKNAVNIPYEEFEELLKHKKYNDIIADRSKIYVVYCERGAMSMIICNKMSQQGYITKTVVGGYQKYNGRYIV